MIDLEGQLCSDGISEQKQEELKKALTDTEAALTQSKQNVALVEGKAPTLQFLCPRTDVRSALLTQPTRGRSVTHIGHSMSRQCISVAITFQSQADAQKILAENIKSKSPLAVAPLPDLYEKEALTLVTDRDVDSALLERIYTVFEATWVFPMGKRLIRFMPGQSKEQVLESAPKLQDRVQNLLLTEIRDDFGYKVWPKNPHDDEPMLGAREENIPSRRAPSPLVTSLYAPCQTWFTRLSTTSAHAQMRRTSRSVGGLNPLLPTSSYSVLQRLPLGGR